MENNATVNFSVDFAILTAIEVERRAVCAEVGLGDKDRVKRNGRFYWRGKLPLGDGKAYEIVVAQPAEMGQVEATALATEVAQLWTPRAALMVGIAASTKPNEVQLGDVVVGRSVYYYEHGKVTAEGIRPQPEMIPADSDLLKHYAGLASWDGAVLVPRPDGTTSGPSVFQGVIASGDKVIAHEAARDSIASGQRKILALEMEGYGFSRAIWLSSSHIRHLVIRGISDDGNKHKNDDWHRYAAAAAASFAKHFLLDCPLQPPQPKPSGHARPVLAIEYDKRKGWVLRNIGDAAAVRAIVTHSGTGATWEMPVRIPPLAVGDVCVLHWLGHLNVQKIGVRYDDAQGGLYSVTCQHDECRYADGDVFPQWEESAILRHWNV